jgi:hypothetical protein
MTEREIIDQLTDLTALAATMIAEGGGDAVEGNSSVEERIAVGCVVRNRLRTPGRFGDTFKAVCLKNNGRTWQFDCWRPGSGPNHDRLIGLAYVLVISQPPMDPLVTETLALADLLIRGVLVDRVNGATSYYAPQAMVPKNAKPFWVFTDKARTIERPACAIVGSQRFYKDV